jgi:hypothetical protein
MRRFSILQALPLSFYSRDLYRDVAATWRGAGLVYLVVIVTLVTLLVVMGIQFSLSRWAAGSVRGFVDQVPTIVIRHRVVQIDQPMPYVIRDRTNGAQVVVIDTTGQVTSLDGLEARVLLTADRLMYRKSTAETRVFNISAIDHFTIDSARAARWLDKVSTWLAPALTPFVFAGLFVFRLVQLVAFALVGMLVGALARVRLDFSAYLRLTAVALTPSLLLEPLLDLAGNKARGWWIVWTLIPLAYVIRAVLANRRPPEDAAPGAEPVIAP